MRYRVGDKVQITDETSEFYNKKGTVLQGYDKNENYVWINIKESSYAGHRFEAHQVKLLKSAIRGQEVEPSSCCVSGNGDVCASVNIEDCPAKDTARQRTVSRLNTTETKQVCQCVSASFIFDYSCPHYKGLKEVTRGGRKVWRVFCNAVEVSK